MSEQEEGIGRLTRADYLTDEPHLIMPPREAARRIGVSVSTLRRLATIYESVHGALPWEGEDNGGGRLWTDEAVERLIAAKALVAEGRSKSVDNALRALEGGVEAPVSGSSAGPEPNVTAALAAIVAPLVSEIVALRGEVAELKAAQLHLQERLEPTKELPVQAGGTRPEPEEAIGQSNQPDRRPGDQAGGERVEHGVVVSAAMRLERLWRRVMGRDQ